jgi:hypothetical protein
MNVAIFTDVAPCSPYMDWRFRGTSVHIRNWLRYAPGDCNNHSNWSSSLGLGTIAVSARWPLSLAPLDLLVFVPNNHPALPCKYCSLFCLTLSKLSQELKVSGWDLSHGIDSSDYYLTCLVLPGFSCSVHFSLHFITFLFIIHYYPVGLTDGFCK